MIGIMRAELIRMQRGRFLYGGIGLLAGFTALISVFVFTSATDEPGDGPGPAATPSVIELEGAGGFLASLGTLANLVGVIVLAFWAIAVASDYSSGLIRIVAQAEPRRARLLSGKIAALAAATVAGTALVTLVATALARPLAELADVATGQWRDGFAIELVQGFANLTVAALVWGLVGLLVALLSRSSGVAIAVGVGYLLVVENLVAIVAEDASDYLPGGTLRAVVAGGTDDVGYGLALALAALYALAAVVAAAVVVRRRDIVA